MRESCTYGSMRGRAYPITRGVPLYSTCAKLWYNYAMRPLRNFKTNQCCHLISRIANRAFFLNDEEKTRFVERL